MTHTSKPEGIPTGADAAAKTGASDTTTSDGSCETETRLLSPAAKRALAEAEARRKAREADNLKAERELGGRGGADPARYGDWEINGRAIDF